MEEREELEELRDDERDDELDRLELELLLELLLLELELLLLLELLLELEDDERLPASYAPQSYSVLNGLVVPAISVAGMVHPAALAVECMSMASFSVETFRRRS